MASRTITLIMAAQNASSFFLEIKRIHLTFLDLRGRNGQSKTCDHKRRARELLRAKTKAEHDRLSKKYGLYYSVLLELTVNLTV